MPGFPVCERREATVLLRVTKKEKAQWKDWIKSLSSDDWQFREGGISELVRRAVGEFIGTYESHCVGCGKQLKKKRAS